MLFIALSGNMSSLCIGMRGEDMNFRQWWVVRQLKDIAYEVKKISGFPASAFISQAIWETGWLKYIPCDTITKKKSNNILGIKAKPGKYEGTNGYVTCGTHEWDKVLNKYIFIPKATFRAYFTYKECMLDYVNVIKNSTIIIGGVELKRYRRALTNEALRDMRIFIQEIWEAGYATDKFYPANVIKIAEKCGLIPKIMG